MALTFALPATLVGAEEPASSTSTTVEPPPAVEPPGESALDPTASTDGTQGPGEETEAGADSPRQLQAESASATATTAVTGSSTATATGSASVAILDGDSTDQYRFSPASITIAAADAVTWTNNGRVPEGHNVKGDGFESGTLEAGQSYSHTFSSPGTFPYICSIHPFMKGTVTVQASSSGSGGGGTSGGGTSGAATSSGTGSGTTTSSGTTPATGTVSESGAGRSPDAAGTATQLPSTGLSVLPLLGAGAGLLLGGLLLRRGRTPLS